MEAERTLDTGMLTQQEVLLFRIAAFLLEHLQMQNRPAWAQVEDERDSLLEELYSSLPRLRH